MNASASQKVKIGLFVVAGIVLLIAGIFLIGSKRNMFSDTYSVYGIFRNTGGLQEGNMIRFGGVNVGTVEQIRILNDTSVRVDMIIQSDKREFVKADGLASVGSDGLMGDKLLTISPGSPGAPQLKAGEQIKTIEPTDFGAIIEKFTTVAGNAEVITGALANMALQIKDGNGSISRLLYKDDLAVALEGTMRNARALTGSLSGITKHVESGRGSIGELVFTDNLSRSLDKTVVSANTAMGTINDAAYNFSENMKALQGNYFFRGYFKRKAAKEAEASKDEPDGPDDMTEAELQQLRDDADRELLRRRAQPARETSQGLK